MELAIGMTATTLAWLTKVVYDGTRELNRHYVKPNDLDKRCNEIIAEVAEIAGITTEQLKSKSRKREIVIPRQVATFILYNKFNNKLYRMPLRKIGQLLNCHHSTVVHSKSEVLKHIEMGDDTVHGLLSKCEHIFKG